MVKIRLTRLGKKKSPFYRIVVADARSPRDGKFIEQLGTYDTRVNPPAIVFDVEKAKEWVENGAQMTDIVASILAKTENPKLNKATDYSKAVSKKKQEKAKLAAEQPEEAPIAEETPTEAVAEDAPATEAVVEEAPVAEEVSAEEPATEEVVEEKVVEEKAEKATKTPAE